MSSRYTKKQKSDIIRLWKKGETKCHIAKLMNISVKGVRTLIEKEEGKEGDFNG